MRKIETFLFIFRFFNYNEEHASSENKDSFILENCRNIEMFFITRSTIVLKIKVSIKFAV